MEDLLSRVLLRIAKRASPRREFYSLKFEDVLHNWDASFKWGPYVSRRIMTRVPPIEGILKFNVDGATRGKLGPASIGGFFAMIRGLC